MKPESALVVGGGFAGLSAAIHLAVRGLKVTLLEAQDALGGKAGEFRKEGYRFDTGPSVFTLPQVLEEVFKEAGEPLPITYKPLIPICRYSFATGRVWEVFQSVRKTIDGLSDSEANSYRALLAQAQRLYEGAAPTFVQGKAPGMKELVAYGLRHGLRAHPFRNLRSLVKSYRVSPELEPFYLRFATYAGADPFRAPAVLLNILWAEVGMGVSYPQGGIGGVVRALADLAGRLGVTIRTGVPVTHFVVDKGRVVRAETPDGGIAGDVVVSAIDVTETHRLLGRRNPYERLEPSLSGFVLLLGLEGESKDLSHHNIFFSKDYAAEFAAIRAGRPADDPTLYLAISAKTSPGDAPEGHENWFVMANAPALPKGGFDWQHEAPAYAELLIDRLEGHGLKVSGRVRLRHWLTPEDFAKTGWRGGLYGHAPQSLRLAIKPGQSLRGLDNLFLAGGTVHPGGGIPLALLSGKEAARLATAER